MGILQLYLQLTWFLTYQQRSDDAPAAASEAKDLKEPTHLKEPDPQNPAPEWSAKPAFQSAGDKPARRGRNRSGRSRSGRSWSPRFSKVRDRKDRSRSRG